jgi:vitamin B12 transporter
MARGIWLVCVLLLGLAVPAAAEEVRRIEPVVVGAERIETPVEQVGGTVSVITGEDFRKFNYTTVEEALRTVPGVDVRRSGSLGKTTSLSIRGANPNQVQVLVDGVRVKSPTLGQADLSDLAPEQIERIEIIRGPQSTLYGADAMGGVVNIITRKGAGPPGGTVQQEVGNLDTLVSRGSVSGSTGPFDYAMSGYHLESNGESINDGVDQLAAALRLGVSLPLRSHLDFTLRWNKTDAGVPVKFVGTPNPIVPTIDPNARQESETLVTTLGFRSRPVDWWETEARIGRYWNNVAFIDRPDPFPCPPATGGPPCDFPGRFKVERREAEWLNHFHIGTWSTSTIGLEYRHEEANVQGTSAFGPVNWTRSAFFQQQFRFFDRLFMSAGVRIEDNHVFGTTTTERGSLAYLVKEWGTRIHGSAGSGFRAPTFNDLFFPGFSNPDLKPEHSFGYDFGVDQKLWNDRIRLGLTYFHTSFTDLIACCEAIPEFPFVITSNIGKARAAGIEFTSEVDLLDTLTASVNYTYTDTKNLLTGRPLPREPFHRWNIGLTWQPIPRLFLFAQALALTRQFDTLGDVYNSGHTRIDVGGTLRLLDRHGFLKALDLTARIDNLLNEGYAEVRGFPAPGITGLVGLRASF